VTDGTTIPGAALPTWPELARRAGLGEGARLLLALSGGADSTWLLHCLAESPAPVDLVAVHVDHALRGAASRADRRFCEELCERLAVPLVVERASLDPGAADLEARARRRRYRALAAVAARDGRTVLTAHHADDALETLVLRWLRGTTLLGLPGPRRSGRLPVPRAEGPRSPLLRPLLGLHGADLRADLARRGLDWREDASNASARFTRNRVRHGLLPWLERQGGKEATAALRSFHDALGRLDGELERREPDLGWRDAPGGSREVEVGALLSLWGPHRRRVLWRFVVEATGRPPGSALLAELDEHLARGRAGRWTSKGAWQIALEAGRLKLTPPAATREPRSR